VSEPDDRTRSTPPQPIDRADEPLQPGQRGSRWVTRLVLALVVVGLAVVGWLVATAFLPRWWAHRIGSVADGSFTAGISAGLVVGAVFTALPLLAVRYMLRRGASWGSRLALLVVAILLAVPNLITLGIVVGTGAGAHAGERTLDVDAPGFRGAALVGAVLGTLLMVALWSLLFGRRRRNRQLAELKGELRRRDAATPTEGEGKP
jgi:MFS family permease